MRGTREGLEGGTGRGNDVIIISDNKNTRDVKRKESGRQKRRERKGERERCNFSLTWENCCWAGQGSL